MQKPEADANLMLYFVSDDDFVKRYLDTSVLIFCFAINNFLQTFIHSCAK